MATDKSGREIRVGDFVVYGQKWLGTDCIELRYGKIVSICKEPSRVMVQTVNEALTCPVLTRGHMGIHSAEVLILNQGQVPLNILNLLSS